MSERQLAQIIAIWTRTSVDQVFEVWRKLQAGERIKR